MTQEPATNNPPQPWEAFKILDRTITVDNDGESFEFTIPSSVHELRIGASVRKIRREIDPESSGPGEEFGWDMMAQLHVKAIAMFVVLLERTSATWVYGPGPDGKPMIDWRNWPADSVERVLEISLALDSAVQRFRARRNKPKVPGAPPGNQAVVGR